MISQDKGEDAKLTVKLKVRDGFQATSAQKMTPHIQSEETQGKNSAPSRMWQLPVLHAMGKSF